MQRQEDDEPSVWQTPDPQGAEERVRRLQARRDAARDSREREDIQAELILARIDLVAHLDQRDRLELELALRRSEEILRQRRDVVELFEATERRLVDDGIGGARLDAARAGLRTAREELERADAERRHLAG